ncbi:MAG: fibronectin type III domain-containing protein [Patescibacteria group bacterium]
MKKNIFWTVLLILFVLPVFNLKVAEASIQVDSLIKGSDSAVYYYAADGNRYVFPNSKTFNSWFVDFLKVSVITDEEMAQIPLKGNVTYRPGIRMVKITTNPEVYAVAKGGILRSLKTEAMAEQLYGADWNKKIDDVPDSFFTNYIIGAPIEIAEDYIPSAVSLETTTINKDKNIPESSSAIKADTVFSGPEFAETPNESIATSTPDQTENTLAISFGAAVAQKTSAIISWSTNQAADSKIIYSLNSSLSAASSISFNANQTINHSVNLLNLISNTTYYYTITSINAGGLSATTEIMSFTTLKSNIEVDPFVVGVISDSDKLDGISSVFVSGNYAYLTARNNNKLTIIDVSDPAAPIIAGSIQDNFYLSGISDVYVLGDYAYALGYNNNYLVILNISNPAGPVMVGSIRDNEKLYTPNSIDISGNYAYVTSFAGSRLTTVDISDKANPAVVGSVQDNLKLDSISAMRVDGNFAYVISKNNNRLTVVDISDSASPAVAGSIKDDTYLDGIAEMDIAGGLVFAVAPESDRLTIVNASDPNFITIASSKQGSTFLNDANSISISGNYAYITTLQNNYFTIMNIGNPFSTPSVAKSISDDRFFGADSIFVVNNYAYVGSAAFDSFIIVDISKYAAGSVLGIKINSNPMNLEPNSLIKNNRFDEIFYVNENFCLQWVANDEIAEKYFGSDWEDNAQAFSDIGGYEYCEYLK